MSNTSWQVKEKYNKKVYKLVSARLKKELVEQWEERLTNEGIGKAEFLRRAITDYLEKQN